MAAVAAGAATGAASGSIVPGIGTLVGGIAGAASGVLGMIGGQNANTANQEEQTQAEQFNLTMAQNQYQIATASMKAAGINPMLAYSQGGISVPAAPMYTNQNTLDGFQSSAQDVGEMADHYLGLKKSSAETETAEAEADVAEPKQQATLSSAMADAERAHNLADISTATKQDSIDTADAQTTKAKADARASSTDADWAPFEHKMKAVGNVISTAKDLAETVGIGAAAKAYLKKNNTGTPSLPKGMSNKDIQDMTDQYMRWKGKR